MARALGGGWSCLLPAVVGVLRGSAIMGLIYVSFDNDRDRFSSDDNGE